jgi:hypothetical protein
MAVNNFQEAKLNSQVIYHYPSGGKKPSRNAYFLSGNGRGPSIKCMFLECFPNRQGDFIFLWVLLETGKIISYFLECYYKPLRRFNIF